MTIKQKVKSWWPFWRDVLDPALDWDNSLVFWVLAGTPLLIILAGLAIKILVALGVINPEGWLIAG